MALQPPMSVDVQEIQFKLHDKHTIFNEGELHNNLSLLSVASNQGLLFAGNPNLAEFKVFIITDLVESQVVGKKPLVRTVALPSVPTSLACSANGAMLAINYTMKSSNILQIYSVPSFTKSQLISLYTVRLSPEENVMALQLLWNPVLNNMLAVVHSNGAISLYTFKEGGQFELHSLNKSYQVQCGCWSPKGKQIVLGFANGKLQQFKPDLTPAKTIICPQNILEGPFDTLAVHWLSTFQFAVVYLQQNNPCIYIVNVPKGGSPNYTIYYDICYSGQGPRAHQYNFTHIPQWNLLLICSANGVEIGVLATKDSGDAPKWQQYVLLDEARIELPLTDSKDETYPIGFTLDTAATHQLVLGEQQLPIMPKVHVLSTHGHLISFNFLNLIQNATEICSPPIPVIDESGEFCELREGEIYIVHNIKNTLTKNLKIHASPGTQAADMTFNFSPSNTSTSTPSVKEKTTSHFSANTSVSGFFSQSTDVPTIDSFDANTASKPLAANTGVGSSNMIAPKNVGFSSANSSTPDFSGFALTKSVAQKDVTSSFNEPGTVLNSIEKPNNLNKPLYTVPLTFEPPKPVTSSTTTTSGNAEKPRKSEQLPVAKSQINDDEITEVVSQMIDVQIEAFNTELKHMSKSFFNINDSLDELKHYTRRLNDLQEIIEQANDQDFEVDLQNLRHSLSESYAMIAEFRSKLEQYTNSEISPLANMTNFEAINRRQVSKLQSYLTGNETQLQQIQLQIDTQWSNFQEILRRNSKNKMHIPCLDGIYQRLTKLKNLVARQRTRINYIRTKLRQQGFNLNFIENGNVTNGSDISNTNKKKATNVTIDSLTDSIISISISQAVRENRAKLSTKKLNGIRRFLEKRQSIMLIKPMRPDRVDLNSEVILETKFHSDQCRQRALREDATASLDKMQQQQPVRSNNASFITSYAFSNSNETTAIKKPTATKPTPSLPANSSSSSTTATSKPFSFATGSSFVKPTAVAATTQSQVQAETTHSVKQPSFGHFASKLNFSLPKDTSVSSVVVPEAKPAGAAIPISFVAKVIGGNAVKTTDSQSNFRQDMANLTSFAALSTTNTVNRTTNAAILDKTKDEGNKPSANTQSQLTFGVISKPAMSSNSSAPSFNFASQAVTSTTHNSIPKTIFSGFTNSNTSAVAFSGFGKAIGELATLAGPISTTTVTVTIGGSMPFGIQSTATTNSLTITKTTATAEITSELKDNDKLFAGNAEQSKENLFVGNMMPFAAKNDSSEKPLFTGVTTIASSAASTFTFTNELGALAKNAVSTNLTKTTTIISTPFTFKTTTPTSSETATTTTISSSSTSSVFGSTANAVRPASGSITSGFSGLGALGSSLPGSAPSDIFCNNVSTSNESLKLQTIYTAPNTSTSATVVATSNVSVFGGTASSLNSSASTATNTPFASVATTTADNIFASASSALATTKTPPTGIFGTAAINSTTSSPIAASDGGLFASMPKPEQAVFGSSASQAANTGIFAAVSQITSPPSFNAAPSNNTCGSVFGSGFGSSSSTNIFGGAINSPPTGFGSKTSSPTPVASIFGGAAKPAEGGNLFVSPSPTTTVNTNNGAALFGQSPFGQPSSFGNNFFGSQQGNTAFGSTGSIFGGGNQHSSGSLFGGSSGGTFCGGSGFGSSTNAAGSFAQGGASVAQTGFGSPQAVSAFAKPVFGGTATSFNAQPSFGGGPTFGSPKGFGNFNAPAAVAPQTSPFGAPKDSIFETLGSSETPLSFGNLAQNSNANGAKSAFGGSSFMNYRA